MTSIEKASKSINFNRGGLMSSTALISEVAFKSGVEFAQRWIPVNEELPEQVETLIGNSIKSENVLVKRKWNDTGELAIEINCRFRPSERIGFLWNIDYKGSQIIEWRPVERF